MIKIALFEVLNLLFRILWCAHVTVTPDDNRIIVFNNGISIGLNVLIDFGGQFIPISIDGESLEWKNPQKNEKKNITSDVINKIIPIFIPLVTKFVWFPWNVDSRITSRHQHAEHSVVRDNPIIIFIISFLYNHITVPRSIVIILIDVKIGHGLFVTRWKGWFCFIWNFSRIKGN